MPRKFAKHFCKNPNGSWTCTSHATMASPKGRIQVTEGSRFYPGTHFMGFDLARWLDEELGGGVHRSAPNAVRAHAQNLHRLRVDNG